MGECVEPCGTPARIKLSFEKGGQEKDVTCIEVHFVEFEEEAFVPNFINDAADIDENADSVLSFIHTDTFRPRLVPVEFGCRVLSGNRTDDLVVVVDVVEEAVEENLLEEFTKMGEEADGAIIGR